jgi:hypothetical protein
LPGCAPSDTTQGNKLHEQFSEKSSPLMAHLLFHLCGATVTFHAIVDALAVTLSLFCRLLLKVFLPDSRPDFSS